MAALVRPPAPGTYRDRVANSSLPGQFALVMPPSLSRLRWARPVRRAPILHDIATPRTCTLHPGGISWARWSRRSPLGKRGKPLARLRAALAAMLTAWPSGVTGGVRRRGRGWVTAMVVVRCSLWTSSKDMPTASRWPGLGDGRAIPRVRRLYMTQSHPAVTEKNQGPVMSGQERRVTWLWAARSGRRPMPCRARRRVVLRACAPRRHRRGGHRAGCGGLR
jgi:hypothetical protein